MLTAYVLGWTLSGHYRPQLRMRARLAASCIALMSIFYPFVWYKADARQTAHVEPQNETAQQFSSFGQCRAHGTLSRLKHLPQGTVFSTINLSPPILLTTGLPIVVAPYHRSASALANGFIPFVQNEADFRAAISDMGVRYIVLCRAERRGGFVDVLAEAREVDGLRLLPQSDDVLVVYEVLQ